MENSRLEGIGHQVKGALKETFGKLIGDAKLASDGAAERALGDARSASSAAGGQIVAGVDTDRISGVGHEMKGSIKAGFGALVGDAKLAADGSAERDAGKLQDAAGSARDEAREAAKTGMNDHHDGVIDPRA